MTREEAIDLLDNLIGAVEDNHGSNYDGALKMAIKALEQRWIPLREQLPKENTAVLVWCPTRKSVYSACLERQQWWIFGTYHNVPEVTAWMPMPEPYREDEPYKARNK